MPFYNINEMETKKDKTAPGMAATVVGEFMKVGVMTYEDEIGPPPHFHPNEEQFVLVLEGELRMVLDGEVKNIGPGDLIHVPRNVSHTVRAVGGPARFFTAKHPVGDGELSQDYNEAPNAEELKKLLAGED